MKKVFIALAGLMFLISSCTVKKSDSSVDEAREKNLKATEEINKAIQTGDVSKLHEYIAADAVDHASPVGDIKGIDSIKSMLAKVHTMGTDMKMDIIKTVADADYVFQWMRLTGKAASADMGMPPGTSYDINAVQVSRYVDGKAVEHWEFMQPADMAKMMGAQEGTAPVKESPIIDTVRKP